MVDKIKKHCITHHLIQPGDRILVGLSGGVDSVGLLHILVQLSQEFNCNLIAAHLDHEWRHNSAQDAQFCQEFAAQLQVPCIVKKASEISIAFKPNGSQEELGRMLRRTFFEQIAQEYGACSIALGHHASDQEETFFLRLIRGTTLTGLACMKPKHGMYIRPLLCISKQDILAYAQQHKLAYCQDYTNEDRKYLRNKIRLDVMPALHASDKRFSANLQRTINYLQEADHFLQQSTEQTFNTLLQSDTKPYHLNRTSFLNLDSFMQHHVLMHWLMKEGVSFVPTQAFLQEIIRFIGNNKSNSHQINLQWKIHKKGNFMILEHCSYM